jgi:hypothetical protein
MVGKTIYCLLAPFFTKKFNSADKKHIDNDFLQELIDNNEEKYNEYQYLQ